MHTLVQKVCIFWSSPISYHLCCVCSGLTADVGDEP